MYLPASNTLSSLRSVTTTPRGLVCRKSSSSFFLGLAVGGRVGLFPSTVRPFADSGPRVRGHSRFSPTAYGPRAGHLSVQHFTFHQPKQGRRGLSFCGGGRHCFQAFSTPQLRYVFLCTTLCFLYRISFTNGSIYQGYRFGFSAQFGLATHFSLGEIPPRFDGVQLTVVNSASKAPPTAPSVRQQELSSLLQKGAIEEIPQSDIEQGFFSRYFLVPKRDGGLRPILDLRRLNFSLYKGKFKMLTMKTIMSQIQGGDWFVTIDLKDAYLYGHRKFLRFAFGGKAYQYKALPLALRTFTKMHGCCTGPFEVPGHSCAELSG